MSTSLSSLSCGLEEVASILSGCRHNVWVWIGLMVLLGLLSIVPNICWEWISRRLFSRARRWVSSLQSIFSLLVLNVDTADNSMRRGGDTVEEKRVTGGCCWAHQIDMCQLSLSNCPLRCGGPLLCLCAFYFTQLCWTKVQRFSNYYISHSKWSPSSKQPSQHWKLQFFFTLNLSKQPIYPLGWLEEIDGL